MQSYYSLTQFIANVCQAHPNITTFSMDDIRNIDTEKQTLFPLANLIVNNVTIDSGLMTYNVTLMVMDRVMEIKNSEGPYNDFNYNFRGIDNLVDVHNSTLMALNDIISYVYRNPGAMDYNVTTSALVTPFEERFSNLLAGWAADINITVGNTQPICIIDLSSAQASGGTGEICQPCLQNTWSTKGLVWSLANELWKDA